MAGAETGGPLREGHAQLLVEGARGMGLQLEPQQTALLVRHVDLLLRWNQRINLTAITDPTEVIEKHVLDSIAVAAWVLPGKLLDVGTGAGFPGIPIRILRPDVEVLLVDSVQKKVSFLKTVQVELGLSGVRSRALRLEGKPVSEGIELADTAVARAFAAPADWLALASSYLCAGGRALCLLGPAEKLSAEMSGLVLEQEVAYRLPFSGAQRRIGVFRKA